MVTYYGTEGISINMFLMYQKIEVKVNMHCEKCKIAVLKAVTKLSGIDEVLVDLEKQMLVVIGDGDPVCVVTRVRKIGKIAEMISVGPPKKPDAPKPKPDVCPIVCPPPICNDLYPTIDIGHPQPCEGGSCNFL